eukprot:gnl/TRDRNA2_/TRDRNA2_182960_c0_seq1.p3 gnl/TRDRNA2_/TRDRNA2_182960_c0~~gnl/TRDRNA2_/TRDRNA2_182960_c0_seq1.p3  ORF type:complete len:174 (+),score=40.89 gnl/TRDRNA2_/TRDRNA2_182960_c0_seq1:124-645(+)
MRILRIVALIGGALAHAALILGPGQSDRVPLLQLSGESSDDYKCPPPQDCNCGCFCPELVWPVPPPQPMVPTPIPHFGLIQVGSQSAERIGAQKTLLASGRTAADEMMYTWQAQAAANVPGMAGPPPGAPLNMLPPPPPPPTPPPPPDFRGQPCPENPPCNCYCHCKAPPPGL